MFNLQNKITAKPLVKIPRHVITRMSLLTTESVNEKDEKEESLRMKQFHEKLKLQPLPRVSPRERFVDLVLVETDPHSGDLITNNEKNPTKWGDWQNGGRVSDF